MDLLLEGIQKIRMLTGAIEPWWTIALVPVWQELVFRYLPFKLWYVPTDNFWLVGLVSSLVFALIHWYFGAAFTVVAFFAGLLYWWVMVEYGILAAIAAHALLNIIDLSFGVRHMLVSWFE